VPNELWVGSGESFKSIAAAVRASEPGDTVYVRAGTYVDDFVHIPHDLNITGVGGKAHIKATVAPSNGKASLVTNGNIALDNLEFSGVRVPDGNGAGIRHEGGHLTIKNSYFHDNEMGLLTKAVMPEATVTIEGSEFARMGNGSPFLHGVYINHIKKVTVSDSVFHHTKGGHHFKSRAAETSVEDSTFYDGQDGRSSYAIDIPNGGKAVIRDNDFQKGPKSENPSFISFGAEGATGTNSLVIGNNSFTSDRESSTVVHNHTQTPAKLINNSYDNVKSLALGPYSEEKTSVLAETMEASPAPADPASQTSTKVTPEPVEQDAGDAGKAELHGTEGNDRLFGGPKGDRIVGYSGSDNLSGGAGDDVLVGGPGRDVLLGGSGADRFVYEDVNNSPPTKNHADSVLDFSALQGDRIELSGIDADITSAGHQSFTFVGTQPFSGTAGELSYHVSISGVGVQGDIDGDGKPDLHIDLLGVTDLSARELLL
jgi:Ca2+-binding RTX toxin-like protein